MNIRIRDDTDPERREWKKAYCRPVIRDQSLHDDGNLCLLTAAASDFSAQYVLLISKRVKARNRNIHSTGPYRRHENIHSM